MSNFLEDISRRFDNVVLDRTDLRPYQADELVPFLRATPKSAAYVGMGLGKAQPLSAKVLTPYGWKMMGELRNGSKVIGSNGKPTRVRAVYPQGILPVFKVTFSDGAITRCCDEHLWEVASARERYAGRIGQVLTLAEIRSQLLDKFGNSRHFIPLVMPVQLREQKLSIDPYLLGVLLGDGGIKYTVTMSSADKEILDHVEAVLPDEVKLRYVDAYNYRLSVESGSGSNPLMQDLRELGLMGHGSDTKYIPTQYLMGSVEQRTALLQGLMDTDGYISADGTMQFSSNSSLLATDVTRLVNSLGGVSRRSIKVSASGKDHYVLTLALPDYIVPFRLSRKLARVSNRTKYKPTRSFKSVVPDGQAECVCIEVEAEDRLYVTDDCIVTHNTAAILTLLDDLFMAGEVEKVLIVAPVRVAVQTWPTELSLWQHTAWMTHSLIRPDPSDPEVTSAMRAAYAAAKDDIMYTPAKAAGLAQTEVFRKQRIRQATRPAQIYIVNREFVADLVKYFGRKWPYDCVIIDESTSFADHKTARWQAMAKVSHVVKRLHLLSGTPAPEGIQQLFAQTYLLDHGVRFGRSIGPFRKKYMMMNPYTNKWSAQLGAVEAVTDLIRPIAMVMREEDYLPMDKPLLIERPIVLEKPELAKYKEFERTLMLSLPDEVEIEAVNAGVLSGKLLQYASGAVYDAERKCHTIHDHKITDLKEFVEENPREPLLVAYWFQSSKDRLLKAFPKAVAMDKEGKCVDDWNAGKIPLLLVHPQSAGHGLNMQKGPGHILVFFDTPASLEMYQQLIKRIARPGQRKLVRVYHQVAMGTLDKLAVPKLRKKEDAQDEIMGYLRRLRKRISE